MGTFIDIGVVQPNHRRFIFGDSRQLGSQRRVHLFQPFTRRLFQPYSEHFHSHRIHLGYLTVHIRDDNSHRGGLNKQVQEVILLAHPQPLILELFHHAVEYIHDSVRLVLPPPAEAAAEILLAQ